MIRMSVSVHTRKNDIRELSARAQKKTKEIVFADAKASQEDARSRARVDTGEMREGLTAQMLGPYEYELSGKAEHTVYNEYGTSKMPAQPMITPSVEAAAVRLPKALAEAFRP